jgi:hypothetical protein
MAEREADAIRLRSRLKPYLPKERYDLQRERTKARSFSTPKTGHKKEAAIALDSKHDCLLLTIVTG